MSSLALYEYATHAKTANEGQGDDIVHNSDSRYRRSRAWCQAGLGTLSFVGKVRGTELSERLQTIQTSSQEKVEGDIHTLFMDSSDHNRDSDDSLSQDGANEGQRYKKDNTDYRTRSSDLMNTSSDAISVGKESQYRPDLHLGALVE